MPMISSAFYRFRPRASVLSVAALVMAVGLLLGKLWILWPTLS